MNKEIKLGARTLTVEELDRRHAEKRERLLAREAEYAEARRKREAAKASQNKFELLGRFLERNELALSGLPDGGTNVFWGAELIGTINEVSTEPTE